MTSARKTLVTGPSSTNPTVYEQTLARFGEAGYCFRSVVEAGGATWPDILVAVASGDGIAFAPASLQEGSDAGKMVVRRELYPQLRMPATFVAWRADAPSGLRGFFETAREVARNLWASSAAVASASP
jgi:DNA-binding transcriptional LysR family regulator